jgi:hypothetical protein
VLRNSLFSVTAGLATLGGAAYIGVALPPNSVGTAQLKSGAVVSAKVRNGSLLARDFAPDQLPPGPPGPPGETGPPGPPATALWALVDQTGKLAAGSSALKATFSKSSGYLVTFDRDVTHCAVSATAGGPNPQVILSAFATTAGVEVHIASRATGAVVQDGFSVALFC